MPFVVDQRDNFRWGFIRNEYRVRLIIDTREDWFIIDGPKKAKASRAISNTVYCSHISALLKTKNLYLAFDDENGIGTIRELADRALAGTGWKVGQCYTMYERDGETEKVRSLTSDGKQGAYQLIADICGLFNAYPIYHGDTKTLEIRALKNKKALYEMSVDKNMTGISAEYNSENIITRLYVEGEYGDYGYVGIDKVNPTGLTYLMNFDHYKQVGLFTQEHQEALDTYLEGITAVVTAIREMGVSLATKENELNVLWGQPVYSLYEAAAGSLNYVFGSDEDHLIEEGDLVYVYQEDGSYKALKAGEHGHIPLQQGDLYAVKYITRTSGTIGAHETAIEAKEKTIASLQKRIETSASETTKERLQQQIDDLQNQIQELEPVLFEANRKALMLVKGIGAFSA